MLASLLDVQSLCYSRENNVILQDICFQLIEKQIIYLSGPNGSGKSTLLKLLANLLNADSGNIHWRQTGLFAYLGHKLSIKHFVSPIENILYAANGYQKTCSKNEAIAFLDQLQLGETVGMLQSRDSISFSFGQQRKISMACVMASHRQVWILDEPFTGLDQASKSILNQCFQEKVKQGGAIILASHIAPEVYHQAIKL